MAGETGATDSTRRALDAPSSAVTFITSELLELAVGGARASERRRMILPLHKSPDDSLQRMFNAMQPGTYVPPHRHVLPPKAECILVLRGSLCFVTFDVSGRVDQMTDLVAGSDVFGVDLSAGIFHTFFILEPDTVVFEVKPGPYSPIDDKDFAPWAPREGDAASGDYLAGLQRLRLEQM
jgi:cupin fold WbuC family metalloprotein